MKWALKKVARLYPLSWRKRYGSELEALLEDTHPNWLTLADVLKGALSMQLLTWTLPRLTLVCAIAGTLIAAVIAFVVPQRYASEALFKIVPQGHPEEVNQAVRNAFFETFTRSSLTQVINTFNLYQGERSRMPIADVIDNMKKHIQVMPINGNLVFMVKFVYPDRRVANYVTNNLTGRLIMANNAPDSPVRFQLLDPASFSQRPEGLARRWQIAIGLISGILAGILLFLVSSRRRKSVPCPTCGRPMASTVFPQTAGESAGHP